MSILLIEDDEFKATDIVKVLQERWPNAHIDRAKSVTSALRAIMAKPFSLIVLDMSLPTFDLTGPGGGGSAQGQGGLEVLRLSSRLSTQSTAPIIVVTQYPDIEIEGPAIAVGAATKSLRHRFHLDVRACLLYEFDGDSWREPLRHCLSNIDIEEGER